MLMLLFLGSWFVWKWRNENILESFIERKFLMGKGIKKVEMGMVKLRVVEKDRGF